MILGDFNRTTNNELDRSGVNSKRKRNPVNGKLPNTFFNLIKNENLIDVKEIQKLETILSIQIDTRPGLG